MEDRHIVAIDLGTSKILLTVAKIESDGIRLIYGRETPSDDGIRYSHVVNPARVGEAIRRAVSLAEAELGMKLTQVVVGYPRYEVKLKASAFGISRSEDECVTAEDLRNLKRLAMDSYGKNPEAKEEETLFDAVAQSFNCGDDEFQILEKYVIGMTTEKLSANFKLFVGETKYVSDMERAFKMAGNISVMRKYFTPETTAKAVLYNTEMENGVALIDLGAGITSVSIYLGGIMRHYAAIPFGGKSVTADIRSICAIPETLAENIKKAYGACMPDRLLNFGDKTLVITTDKALPSKQLSVQHLSEIINAREEEIINAALYEIQESGFADMVRSVVLTGGGAEMVNISNLFRELSGYSVRIGEPRSEFFTTYLDLGTGGAAAMGMILMANEEGCTCSCSDVTASESEDGAELTETGSSDGGETVFSPPSDDEVGNKGKDKRKGKHNKEKKKGVETEPEEEGKPEGGKWGDFIGGLFGNIFEDEKA